MTIRALLALAPTLLFAAPLLAADPPLPLGEPQTYILESEKGEHGRVTATLRKEKTGYVLEETLNVRLAAYSKKDTSELRLAEDLRPLRFASTMTLTMPRRPADSGTYKLRCTFEEKIAHAVVEKDGRIVKDTRVPLPERFVVFEPIKAGQWTVLAHVADWRGQPATLQAFPVAQPGVAPLLLKPVREARTLTLKRGDETVEPRAVDLVMQRMPVGRLFLDEANRLLAALLPGGMTLRREDVGSFTEALRSPDAQSLHALLDTLESAWGEEDIGKLIRVYAEAFVGAACAPGGKAVIRNRLQTIQGVRAAWDERDYTRHAFVDRHVEVHGATATARAVLEDRFEGGPLQRIPLTILFAKGESGWKIVSYVAAPPRVDPKTLEKLGAGQAAPPKH